MPVGWAGIVVLWVAGLVPAYVALGSGEQRQDVLSFLERYVDLVTGIALGFGLLASSGL